MGVHDSSMVAPYFDTERLAWVVSQYRDVTAALRSTKLQPTMPLASDALPAVAAPDHERYRRYMLRAVGIDRIRAWEPEFTCAADRLVRALPIGRPADLIDTYAAPFARAVAVITTGIKADDAPLLVPLTERVFSSACEPYDAMRAELAREATRRLALAFQGSAPLNMQMFIALMQSLPAFLGMAWLTLLRRPAELAAIQRDPSLMPRAIDELLRLVGPTRVQFRQAVERTAIGDVPIEVGERLILRLDDANCDPARFPDPSALRFNRRSRDHVAFGRGTHACVGALLIRSLATIATSSLCRQCDFDAVYVADPVECFAMRYVASLRVSLHSRA